MKIRMHSLHLNNLFFFTSYGLFLLFTILSTSFYYRYFMGTEYKLIIMLCIGLLIMQEIVSAKYTIKSLASMITCILFVLLTIRTSSGISQTTISCTFMFIYVGRKIPFERIAKFTIIMSSFIVSFIIFTSLSGLINNYVAINSYGRLREYLGFRYALYAPAYVFNITSLYIYVKKEKIKWRYILLHFFINLWVFEKTDSRLSFYLIVMLLLITICMKYKPDIFSKRKMICKIMTLSFIITFISSLYLTINYNPNNKGMYEINKIFENRLVLGQSSLEEHGIYLFGQKISWTGHGLDAFGEKSIEEYTYVDNFYIQILQRYGILFTLLFLSLTSFALIQSYRKKDYYLLIILTFLAGHCIVDDLVIYLYYNTFWFSIGILLMQTFKKNRIYKRLNNDDSLA